MLLKDTSKQLTNKKLLKCRYFVASLSVTVRLVLLALLANLWSDLLPDSCVQHLFDFTIFQKRNLALYHNICKAGALTLQARVVSVLIISTRVGENTQDVQHWCWNQTRNQPLLPIRTLFPIQEYQLSFQVFKAHILQSNYWQTHTTLPPHRHIWRDISTLDYFINHFRLPKKQGRPSLENTAPMCYEFKLEHMWPLLAERKTQD